MSYWVSRDDGGETYRVWGKKPRLKGGQYQGENPLFPWVDHIADFCVKDWETLGGPKLGYEECRRIESFSMKLR